MFLLYRGLAYSAGRLIAAAVWSENLVVFLPHRFVRELAVCRCATQMDFLPYRIAEKPEQKDVLLSAAVRLPCSESAQRYCAAA